MALRHQDVRELVAPGHDNPGGEVTIDGIAAAPGIAIGQAFVYARDSHYVEERRIPPEGIEKEVERFETAVKRSERDLLKIAAVASETVGAESAAIFEAQALMLRDEGLYDAVISEIRARAVNADFVVDRVMSRHRQLLKASDNEYLRERASDLLDLQDRLIRHLQRGSILSRVAAQSIVIAQSVTAADIVLFSRRGIKGCAMEFGGATSHVSIMARAMDVPAVVSAHRVAEIAHTGDPVIIDGVNGRVILRPTADTLERYQLRSERYRRLRAEQKELVDLPAVTLDGEHVNLMANLEFREELSQLDEYGAEGVGLFRTEILVLMQRRMTLSEDEQYRIYRAVVEAARPHPAVFRLLDLGGDKMLPMGHREHNPFLGWRGIRILLDKPDLLIPQVRAILRAGAHGAAELLLPMITDIEELRRFRHLLSDVQNSLRDEGVSFAADTPLGIMVEVPSVALTANLYAREVDFFSIGTNDLTQYTLAVDRGNELVAGLYQELHPGLLRLIKMTLDAGKSAGIPVSLCGELAGNARATPLLYGLGLRSFSASPVYLPAIKRIIRSLNTPEAVSLAMSALAAPTARDVYELLDTWLDQHACGMLSFLPNSDGDATD